MANYNKLVSLVVLTAIHNNNNPYIFCGTVSDDQIKGTNAYKDMQNSMQGQINEKNNEINAKDNKIAVLNEGILIANEDFNDSEIDNKINGISKAVHNALLDNVMTQKEIDSIKSGIISLYGICSKKELDKHTSRNLELAKYLEAKIFGVLKSLIHQDFRDNYLPEAEINFTDKSLAYQITYILAELEILRQLTLSDDERTSGGGLLNNLFTKLTIKGHIDSKVKDTIKSNFSMDSEALSNCKLVSYEVKKVILLYVVDYVNYIKSKLGHIFNSGTGGELVVSIKLNSLDSGKSMGSYLDGNKTYQRVGDLSFDDIFSIIEQFEKHDISINSIFVSTTSGKYSINNPGYFKDFVSKIVNCELSLKNRKRLLNTDHYKSLFATIRAIAPYSQVVQNKSIDINQSYCITSKSKSHISGLNFE